MAAQVFTSFEQILDASGNPVSGAKVYVYQDGTTTPIDLFTDPDLLIGHAAANPIVCDSAGRHDMRYFAAEPYKVIVKTSADVSIYTRDKIDPGVATSFGALPVANGGTGATTAGSARTNLGAASSTSVDALASDVADFAAQIAALSLISPPQGYLTLTSATPIITGDVAAATSVYYTPFIGSSLPIWNGTGFSMIQFSELTLSLVSSHTASSIYDVFLWQDPGDNNTLKIITGPAWNVITAAAGSRGTGAGTTELERVNGFYVNKVSMTGRNGSTTYSVSPRYALYVGSLFMDGSNGQITCHRSYGQSRKWGVWNAYNRKPIILKMGDATATWSYATGTIRQSNGGATNVATVFSGLAEAMYVLDFYQKTAGNGSNSESLSIGIGWNSTTAYSGMAGGLSTSGGIGVGRTTPAKFIQVPSIGINNVNACELGGTGITFSGAETNMLLTARWEG